MIEERIQTIADQIYLQIGGVSNVDKIIHCMTRVRIEIRDYSKVKLTALKEIEGVMGGWKMILCKLLSVQER